MTTPTDTSVGGPAEQRPPTGPDAEDLRQADLPPVMPLAISSLGLAVIGGIVLAAQYGRVPSLVVPTALAAVGGLLLVTALVLLARVRVFAWPAFGRVMGWGLVAYCVEAGILAFVFVHDHTPTRELLLFGAMLLLFAVDVPLMLGFSVARWQPAPEPGREG